MATLTFGQHILSRLVPNFKRVDSGLFPSKKMGGKVQQVPLRVEVVFRRWKNSKPEELSNRHIENSVLRKRSGGGWIS